MVIIGQAFSLNQEEIFALVKDKKDFNICEWEHYQPTIISKLSSSMQKVAESLFGSHSYLFNCRKREHIKADDLIKKIDLRHNWIYEYIEHFPINPNLRDTKFDKLWDYIIWEMEKPIASPAGENLWGWQNGFRLSKEQIIKSPFHAMLLLNSTRGRLHTIQNWEKLIIDPHFLNRDVFDNVFGFNVWDPIEVKSKFLYIIL